MNEPDARVSLIQHLIAKADMAMAAARRDQSADDLGLATNRIYYACFYAASAVLLCQNMQFSKHTAVRGAIHQHLVRPGHLSKELGRFYDRAFAERQEADYNALATFDPAMVAQRILDADRFVAEMKRLLASLART